MNFFYVKFFWKFLFSANIMLDFNKWGLKWNDRIPFICFSKKILIFLNSTLMKMKKILKNPQEGGTYAQISMRFRTLCFSSNLKQQKAFVLGEPMAKKYLNMNNSIFSDVSIYFLKNYLKLNWHSLMEKLKLCTLTISSAHV